MLLIRGNQYWARFFLLGWVSLWMLIVPWVHIHPEVEHNHGKSDHAHHAITHTVFSSPLACEHSTEHDVLCPVGSHHHVQFNGHGGQSLVHPEIGFTFSPSSDTSSFGKILLSPSRLIEDVPSPTPISITESISFGDIPPSLAFIEIGLPLRAPPAFRS